MDLKAFERNVFNYLPEHLNYQHVKAELYFRFSIALQIAVHSYPRNERNNHSVFLMYLLNSAWFSFSLLMFLFVVFPL